MKTLEELESVDWKSLKHAYGNASDVPQLIRDLTSKRKKTREKAFEILYSNLYHQGSIYSATPHAVPFFIGLLQRSDLPDHAGVLGYLAALATGSSFLDVHQSSGLDYFDKLRRAPGFHDELQMELNWVNNTRQNVAAGLPYFVRFMDSPDLNTQLNAFFLIGELIDDSGRQLLVERVMNDDTLHIDVIATTIFGLRGNKSCSSELIKKFRNHESPIVKYGIAMLCAQFAPELATPLLLKNLVDFLADVRLVYEEYDHLPFSWAIPFDRYAGLTIVDLRSSADDCVIDYLISQLPNADLDTYEYALRTLLTLTFSTTIDPTNLTAQQVAALTAIGNHKLTWEEDDVCRQDAFEEFRIPNTKRQFQKLLATSKQSK